MVNFSGLADYRFRALADRYMPWGVQLSAEIRQYRGVVLWYSIYRKKTALVMTRVRRITSLFSSRRASVFTVVSKTVAIFLTLISTCSYGFDMPGNLDPGWDGSVQLGALATFGETDSSAVSARATFTFRSTRWEHELDIKLQRSESESLVPRRDESGEIVRDADDKAISDLVSSTTNNRRFASGQARWFFTSRYYLFAIADWDVNTPADLELSTRYVGGVGYKLYRSKNHLISAGIGFGRKGRDEVSGYFERGPIGYLGFKIKRKIGETLVVGVDLDSDFGSEQQFSEAEFSLSWKLRNPLSLQLKYEASFNSTVFDSLDSYNEGLEAALSVSLSVEVF